MADHDVAVLDATSWSVDYVNSLMNICMDLAVNPASGQIAVVGTDADHAPEPSDDRRQAKGALPRPGRDVVAWPGRDVVAGPAW